MPTALPRTRLNITGVGTDFLELSDDRDLYTIAGFSLGDALEVYCNTKSAWNDLSYFGAEIAAEMIWDAVFPAWRERHLVPTLTPFGAPPSVIVAIEDVGRPAPITPDREWNWPARPTFAGMPWKGMDDA